MSFQAITGVMAVSFSWLAKGGMAHQIAKNWRRKTCDGISVPFYFLGMLSYVSLMLYGIVGHDLAVIISPAPGALLCLAVIIQYVLYDTGKKEKENG